MGKRAKPSRKNKPLSKDGGMTSDKESPQVLSQHFSGPLPPPAMLDQYEKLHPGFTAHLLEENRLEREHRQKMEEKATRHSQTAALMGILAAILVVAAFIGLVYYALVSGNGKYVGSIIGFPMVALVGVFITRKYFQRKDPE